MSDDAHDDPSWSMIARAAAGDPRARSVLTRGFLPVVRSFLAVRWRGTPLQREVDDAVQEVCLECLREQGALTRADPARGDLRALLHGVARNVAARFEERWQRRCRREAATGSVIERIQDAEPSLSRMFDREWARTLLRMAGELMRERAELGSPGARLRVELLRLRFHDGMPIRDIALHWEMDPDSVHRAYARAREEFRSCLFRIVRQQVVRSEQDVEDEVARVLRLLG